VPAPDLGVLKEAPATLAATGLPEDGTVPAYIRGFKPRYELWSDAATKERLAYLPGCEAIDAGDMDRWSFPVGSRFWKHFRVGGALVETRFLHRFGAGAEDWVMATYHWDTEGKKATLVKDGVVNANGTEHDIPKQNQCARCHGFLPEKVLGFSALQLSHPGTELSLPKLVAEGRLPEAAAAGFSPPGDATAQEALGYLHANCGHCHNEYFGLPLRMSLRLGDAKIEDTDVFKTGIGVQALFQAGGFSTRIVPGEPDSSLLIHRMASRGNDAQMPPLATEKKDDKGLAKVAAWITALKEPTPVNPGPPEPLATSGSRLKARHRVSSDGYKEFLGWYDTELGLDCTVDLDLSGIPRCLPEPLADGVFFSNADCSEEAVRAPCLAPGVETVRAQVFDPNACDFTPRFRVLRLGPPAKGTPYGKNGGVCEALDPVEDLRPVLDVVASSQFVPFFPIELPAREDGFGLVVYESPDGARQAIGAWSQVAGKVRPLALDDGKEHWAPSTTTAFHLPSFSDAACKQTPVGYSYTCAGTPVVALGPQQDTPEGQCGGQALYNVLEPLPDLQKIYASYSGVCAEEEGPPGVTWYRLGDKLQPQTLPTIKRVATGGTRLQRSLLSTPGGQPVVYPYDAGDFFDTQEGVPCLMTPVGEGTWRCVPRGYFTQIFSDSACKTPVVAIPKVPDSCTLESTPNYALQYSFSACGAATLVVRSVQGEINPTQLFTSDGGACSPLGGPDDQQRYFSLSAPVDLSKFVELTETKEN
jgi:hypothetical protein